ncbi:hypothetical protein MTR67_044352 [Solanum verrucosum]|uniref:Uncharacterized protein n=1 Tax=Solanum verrucosum TaxID=315347 RepID=A0AAF0URF0_SOLVR|nr:hypothetical protein MTR67_044352 [Solanum verrucosum]
MSNVPGMEDSPITLIGNRISHAEEDGQAVLRSLHGDIMWHSRTPSTDRRWTHGPSCSFTPSCMLSTFQVLTHTCATSSRDVGSGSQHPDHA